MPKKRLAKKSSTSATVLQTKVVRERGRSITYELRPTLCGKPNCRKLHGPYWYAYWSQGGRVRSVYIGKKFQRVEQKCPERLA